jgi:asparagine synthase (glutamine-hydrolysing)
MSGIAGIVNMDGAPVDARLLWGMTRFLAFRGPDAQDTWACGSVGFGHALLRTAPESAGERQPCSLDGRVWITADARIDRRASLIRELSSSAPADLGRANDVELILHAYRTWGARCIDHLLGDFAFAIWDDPENRLFCARDHLGAKPFYYARVGPSFVFSNTLNCLRAYPGVSDRLNDQAIGDFLLFDFNQDPATTTFADIFRLPPAHTLDWSPASSEPRLHRYWSLPTGGQVRYSRAGDYVEHFTDLLSTAVADRLRTTSAAIFLSGGLDSSSIAALARGTTELRGYTAVVDHLCPDEERHYTGIVSQSLQIPVEFLPIDDYELYERWDLPAHNLPEPSNWPMRAVSLDQFRQAQAYDRVILAGNGGDEALWPSPQYLSGLLRNLRLWRLGVDSIRFASTFHRIPRWGIRSTLRRVPGASPKPELPFPVWLDPGFSKRLDLPARFQQFNSPSSPLHPTRPEAYRLLAMASVPILFEQSDPGTTLIPAEVRYPYYDVELLAFLLAVPPIPWFFEKHLLRMAMRGRLPDEIRLRPKTPVLADPVMVRLRRSNGRGADFFLPAPELTRYVSPASIPQLLGEQDVNRLWTNLRPLSLNQWLIYCKPALPRYNAVEEKQES